MTFFLKNLPSEVLASITPHLQTLGAIAKLHACGDRVLLHRLKSYASWNLQLTSKEPLGSVLNFVPTLRLTSVSLTHGLLSDTSTKAFIQALPSTLRSFKAYYEDFERFWFLEEGDPRLASRVSILPLNILHPNLGICFREPWAVRDNFPCLECLDIGSRRYLGYLKEIQAVLILCGLPATITDLSLDFLNEAHFGFYEMLPPHLTHLRNSARVVPFSAQHLQSLTSMNLNWDSAPYSSVQSTSSALLTLGPNGSPPALEDIRFPPQLSCLSVRYRASQIPLLSLIPSSLTSLTLRFAGYLTITEPEEESILFTIMSLLPPSLTQLELRLQLAASKKMNTTPIALSQPSTEPRIFAALKTFALNYGQTLLPFARCLPRLIPLLPSVQEFTWSGSSGPGPDWTLESVALFVGTPLRTLEAPLSLDCFPEGNGPYPLHVVLPELQHLRNTSTGNGPEMNFAALPPSLTSFEASSAISSKSLHLLPPSVTKVAFPTLKVSAEGPYFDLLSTGYSRLYNSVEEPKDDQEALLPESSGIRLFFGDRTKIYRSDWNPHSLPHIAPLAEPMLSWPKDLPPMPSNVTDLTIFGGKLFDSWFTPENLPSLRRLSFAGYRSDSPTSLRIGGFKTLLELKGPIGRGDFCPPNLTRLDAEGSIPFYFVLPNSLTHLSCTAAIPPVMIRDLPALTTLHQSGGHYDWKVPQIPSTVTSLALTNADIAFWKRDDFASLFHRLSSLSDFTLHGQVLMPSLEFILETRPSHVFIKAFQVNCTDDTDVAAFTARIGTSHGVPVLHPGEALVACIKRLVRVAYASLGVEDVRIDERRLSNGFLSSVLSSLTAAELRIKDMSYAQLEGVGWPHGMTTLVCDSNLQIFSTPYHFPDTLTKLVLEGDNQSKGGAVIKALPQGLKHLELGYSFKITTSVPWPPSLTHLTAKIAEKAIFANLKAMPASLTSLSLDGVLKQSMFSVLPPRLQKLKIDMDHDLRAKFLQFAKQRGTLVWIPWRHIRDEITGEELASIAQKMLNHTNEEPSAVLGLAGDDHASTDTQNMDLDESPPATSEGQVAGAMDLELDAPSARTRTKRPRPTTRETLGEPRTSRPRRK